MFNKYLIIVPLAMAAVVAANVLPNTVEDRASSTVVYDGSDFSIGNRVEYDYQLTQYGVWGYANGDEVVTRTLDIHSAYEITYIEGHDKSEQKSSDVVATVVSGSLGSNDITIQLTSLSGKDFVYWVDVYVRR